MSFLYPAFLIGALAVAIPIVLHLLRRQAAPEVPFTAVRLLRQFPPEQTRRRRIRDRLLLAARVAALLLLAAAFARPYWTGHAAEPRVHVVAIDRSYSMDAPGRFDRALSLAGEAIDAAGRGDRVAVVAFDDRADVLAAPGSAGQARAALDGLRPSSGGTRYAPVVARAIELSEQNPARLIIVSDLQRAGWEDEEPIAAPATLQVELRDAGAVPSNAAVVDARRSPAGIVSTVRNTASQPLSGTVRLLVDGHQAAAAPFTVAAASSVDVIVASRLPDSGTLTVVIDDPDGYAADNSRYLLLDAAGRARILVVHGEGEQSGFFVTRAIESAGDAAAFEVRAKAAGALGSMPPQELSGHAAVMLLSTRGLDRRAREMLGTFVRGGGGLFVAAGSDVEASVLATAMNWPDFSAVEQPVAPVTLAATDLRHPIFRPFGPLAANLGQVRFSRTWKVRGAGWDVAARFTDGTPALLERSEGKGRVVVFASDVDRRWNDFPLNAAFVPFAVETVRHVTIQEDARQNYLVGQVPRGVKSEPGVHSTDDGRRVAVNVDARESATERMTEAEFKAMLHSVARQPAAPAERRAQQAESSQNLWRYGLMLMLAALVGESVAGRVR